jgi:hypothetical protein
MNRKSIALVAALGLSQVTGVAASQPLMDSLMQSDRQSGTVSAWRVAGLPGKRPTCPPSLRRGGCPKAKAPPPVANRHTDVGVSAWSIAQRVMPPAV